MWLTCAKKPGQTMKASKLQAISLACAVLVGAVATLSPAHAQTRNRGTALEAPVSGAVTVSDTEFNTFLFGAPIKRILFPAGSPVVGKPVYMADNHQVLLQFGKGQKSPVQMVVELESGEVVTMRVQPKSVPGVTHAVNGARPKGRTSQASANPRPSNGEPASARAEDIELLKRLVSAGQPPDGFDPIALPAPARFDRFTVVPLVGWSDTAKRIFVFSLVANGGQTSVVAPPQFYRDGITAVLLDGDVVDSTHSPQLFVVEEVADE